MSILRRSSCAVAAASLMLAVPAAFAGDGGIRVGYSDLDLTTQKGVDTLYRRIHTAAGRYCEELHSRTGSRIATGYEECVTDAVNNTVSSLNLPSLSALHAGRSKQKHHS
jgi:UrcA family protein